MTYDNIYKIKNGDEKKYKEIYDNDRINYMLLYEIIRTITIIVKKIKIPFIKDELLDFKHGIVRSLYMKKKNTDVI